MDFKNSTCADEWMPRAAIQSGYLYLGAVDVFACSQRRQRKLTRHHDHGGRGSEIKLQSGATVICPHTGGGAKSAGENGDPCSHANLIWNIALELNSYYQIHGRLVFIVAVAMRSEKSRLWLQESRRHARLYISRVQQYIGYQNPEAPISHSEFR